METLQAIEARKSTRSYQPKPVESEKVEQLIAAADNAPKSGAIHITVVENKDVLKELNDATLTAMKNSGSEFLVSRAALPGYQPLYGAPLLLILSGPGSPLDGGNASCAAAVATIAATDLGLGSCYVASPIRALNAQKELAAKIGIPEGYSPVCAGLAGYAADSDAYSSHQRTEGNVNYCR